jgi:Type ISP C-terminal specificity domain/N-6 DNA Methylase
MPAKPTGKAPLTATLQEVISAFGKAAKAKLNNPGAVGSPEDQLRAPFERLLEDLAALAGLPKSAVVAVGETKLGDLKTRPDYAVTVHGSLVGFIELKAPGKGADPRKFKDPHDKGQWERLRLLPNLMYTDGTDFSLWQDGELSGSIIRLDGDLYTAGAKLAGGNGLPPVFESFFSWCPIAPTSAKELARVSARMCRFLRDEVTEQLTLKSEALTELATDWRKLLFPDASDERFADGYAQAVTFGLLMARAKGIEISKGLDQVAKELAKSSSLIGAALRLLTDSAESKQTLKTSLGTLERVLSVIDWDKISKGNADAWLYFYEDFLEVYDNDLRKQTGSYYTPPEVVSTMVRLVDEALRRPNFGQHNGIASPNITLADPATGTGTFLLGILRKIADTVTADEGAGAVEGALTAALQRLIAFEIQLGPFAVAQLRILAEIVELTGKPPTKPIRMFVTDTLSNPDDDEGWIPGLLAPIAKSRKDANRIKRDEPITVVIGNPPYKEKAKGRGGWVEGVTAAEAKSAPLKDWMPPAAWGVSAHSKHLRNLYVYFWRWATWKVFDHHSSSNTGIVCFITVAGFLSGPGFQAMRAYMRRQCDDIWVIDCSPEGHQPEVATRIFQGVQQPICIVLAARSALSKPDVPASVRFRALPAAHKKDKFDALSELGLAGAAWLECPADWRAPFLPESVGDWATFPTLADFFGYNGSGVMPGRTWVIAPDVQSLERRWARLVAAPIADKETLFHPHLRAGKPGDKHANKIVNIGLSGMPHSAKRVADETTTAISPLGYANRSFDRQWIIPDSRLINQPNPELWKGASAKQVFLTTVTATSPSNGPATTVTGLIPDLDHYNGRGGRVFPLWRDRAATISNVRPALLSALGTIFGQPILGEDAFAYIVATTANPSFTARFHDDLSTHGLRVPLTTDHKTFEEASDLGRLVIWLHTFGERMVDAKAGRPLGPPRLPVARRPKVEKAGTIPLSPSAMPDDISYNASTRRLNIGTGFIDNVEPAAWSYQVSGKQVLLTWFSSRKKNRERPIIGDRRPPSPLAAVQPDVWLAEYTTELLNLLNVLAWLVDIEPQQVDLLDRICAGPFITIDDLVKAGGIAPQGKKHTVADPDHPDLFETEE